MIINVVTFASILLLSTGVHAHERESKYFVSEIAKDIRVSAVQSSLKLDRFTAFPSLATIWLTNKDDGYVFALNPVEDCAVVILCDMPSADARKDPFTSKERQNMCIGDRVEFRPLEQKVIITQGAKTTTGFFPTTSVRLHNGGANKRTLKYWSTFEKTFSKVLDNYSPPDQSVDLKLESLIVLTSSPYCRVVVGSMQKSVVEYRHILPKDPTADVNDEHPVTLSHTGSSQKTYNDLLVGGTLEIRNELGSECCVGNFEFDGFQRRDAKATDRQKQSTLFIERSFRVACPTASVTEENKVLSFKVTMSEPAKCLWFRLCFDDGEDMCTEVSQTLDVLPSTRVFVPTDSDQAIQFGTEISHLNNIRLIYHQKQETLTMSYSHASRTTSMFYHSMYLKWNPTKTQKVHLVMNGACGAKIVDDQFRQAQDKNDKSEQCIHFNSCKCFD